MIEIADKWTRQPQRPTGVSAEWKAKGLVALFDTRLGVELIHGNRASNLSTTLTPAVAGMAADFSGTANQQYAHRPAYATTGAMTLVILCDVDALSSYGALIAKQATSTTYCPYELRIGDGSTDSKLSWLRGANGTYVFGTASASNLITAGDKAVRLIWRINADSTAGSAFVNGAKYDFSAGGGVPLDNGASVWIGRRSDGATQLDGRIYYVALFNRAISDGEAQAITRNPWQLYTKRPKRVFVSGGGGGGGSDVTVALTGQAATASAGTLVPSSSKALSGQAVTASAGTLTPTYSLALTGSAVTTSAGTLTPSASKALLGTAVTVSAGTVTPSTAVALSGQAVTVSAGTITYNAGSDITLALSGQDVTASAGTLVPSSNVSLAGSAVTASAGTVVPTFPRTLSGSAVTASAGTVTPSMSVPLVGQAVTVSAGTITYAPQGDVTVALTGEAVTVSAGTLTPSGADAPTQTGGFAGGWHAVIKGKRVFGRREDLIRLMQAEAIEDAREAAEEKPRAAPKPKPKKVIEEVQEVIEEQTVAFVPAAPEVVKRDETALRNMLSRIYAEAYRAEYERQAEAIRRAQDDEDEEVIFLAL